MAVTTTIFRFSSAAKKGVVQTATVDQRPYTFSGHRESVNALTTEKVIDLFVELGYKPKKGLVCFLNRAVVVVD